MAERRPVVIAAAGHLEELPTTDTLPGSGGGGGVDGLERGKVVAIALQNFGGLV